jgi:hypothetical protein
MKKKYLYYIFALIILSIVTIIVIKLLNKRDPLVVDISDIDVKISVDRFEHDLFKSNDDITKRIDYLNKKYPVFFEIFNEFIINIGPAYENGEISLKYINKLNTFIDDFAVRQAMQAVDEEFENIDELNEILTKGFKHYLYYYPDSTLPRVISYIAGFNHSIVTYDSIIAIGLDKYLGSECELYYRLQIPEYARFVMDRKFIPYDAMRAYAEMLFPYNDSADNLVNRMVYEGQILYFLDAMYPGSADELKIGYSQSQLEYCINHERDMWAYLIENKVLFTTNYLRIKNFVGSAPFTKDFGNESPPRSGVWLGWQIVRSYMKNNSVSLQELMKMDDYYIILKDSQYDP